jgi:hypothetical protein
MLHVTPDMALLDYCVKTQLSLRQVAGLLLSARGDQGATLEQQLEILALADPLSDSRGDALQLISQVPEDDKSKLAAQLNESDMRATLEQLLAA